MNGIGDFVSSIKETQRLAAQIAIEMKGEAAGHPFRGNQWGGGGSIGDEPDYSKMSPDELSAHVDSLALEVDKKKNQYFDADKRASRAAAVRVTPEARELVKVADQKMQEWNEAQKKYQKAYDASEEGKKRLAAMGEYTRTHPIPAVQQGRFSTSR